MTEGYIAVNEEYTLKEFKNVLNSSGNLNIYNINKFNNKLISSGSSASKSDIKTIYYHYMEIYLQIILLNMMI